MRAPYQCLENYAHGCLTFAARWHRIHTLDKCLNHISTWTHPRTPVKTQTSFACNESAVSGAGEAAKNTDEQPTKRRRLEHDGEGSEKEGGGDTLVEHSSKNNGQASSQKNEKRCKKGRGATNQERPFILSLNLTSDGRHLIAVTGSDKTIWVFEHDLNGHLSLLSQRAMPKRPCSVALTRDGQAILSADKFGDVYALPLLVPDQGISEFEDDKKFLKKPQTALAPARYGAASLRSAYKPRADETMVHTKRNRIALDNQKREEQRRLQRLTQQQEGAEEGDEKASAFAHVLVLGHVSMLTAICVGFDPDTSRDYIITADRDEHIRVSRGTLSQAHIIETFCLGHTSFVSRLCMIGDDMVLSGGGDDALLVWEWKVGKLLSKVDLLSHVRSGFADAERVAVSGLAVMQRDRQGTSERHWIFATCERIPAVFVYLGSGHQRDNSASYRVELEKMVRLDANPLSMKVIEYHKLLVAMDDGPRLITLGPEDASANAKDDEHKYQWPVVSRETCVLPSSGQEDEPTRDELDRALYTIENLRKTRSNERNTKEAAAAKGERRKITNSIESNST